MSRKSSLQAKPCIHLLFLIVRWTYIEFYSRYSILMSQEELGLNHKKLACKTVLQRLIQVRVLAGV